MGESLFDWPTASQAWRVTLRLLLALALAGLIGYERQRAGKAAGLRTHMLVALGSTLFVLAPLEGGMTIGDAGRVIQGIVAGIGFLGAGAILKRAREDEVSGLTTAASIWFTAAIGTTVGVGHLWLPVLATLNLPSAILMAIAVLAIFRFRIGMLPVLAACSLAGVVYYLVTGATG